MGRQVKRLSNLEIDEISVVDRPANQHGTIAISKADTQEDSMADIYDAEGNEVFWDELQEGDLVYDEDGVEYEVQGEGEADDGDADELYELEDYEEDLEPVGKVAPLRLQRMARSARLRAGEEKLATQMFVGRKTAPIKRRVGEAALPYRMAGGRRIAQAQRKGYEAGARARSATGAALGNRGVQVGLAGAGVGGAAGAGGYYGGRRSNTSKSLGEQVLEELSKSYSDDDRDRVIAKALNQVDLVAKRNDELENAIGYLLEERDAAMFHEVAKSYELGAEDDIAGLLQRASQLLPEADVALLDRFFTSAGEVQKAYFEEIGYAGAGGSSTLDEVYAYAGEAVAKNAGLSQEQAVTAMFAANPEAYDAYEAETRTRD